MQNAIWQQALERAADPRRARHYFEQFTTAGAGAALKKFSAEQARVLAALFSGSQALSETLLVHPDWLDQLDLENLQRPRHPQGLQRETEAWLKPLLENRDYRSAYATLRQFKLRELLRIGARDLARLSHVSELTRELSDVADLVLNIVHRIAFQQLTERLGLPHHQDPDGNWRRTEFCVLGMGKLGGRELNYSSDVDVLFVYSEEGFAFKDVPQRKKLAGKGLSNHQFFTRLAEKFISEVSQLTAEGMLYRIDLRLRPEGNAGPLVRSLGSYENYYAQSGRTWERMMLIKARWVAGDIGLASEFLETIQPFRYPRSLGEGALHEIAAMKQRVENEVVKAGELDRNVKLGRGGIREIEFTAQTLQLLNAGRIPFLQGAQTLPALKKLVDYHLLPEHDAEALSEAYSFLRDIEHRLQMENHQQTHTIPTDRKSRERLAALMGFPSLPDFEAAHQRHRNRVREIYGQLLQTDQPAAGAQLPREIQGAESQWKEILSAHSFRDPDQALHLIDLFVNGPGYGHISSRTIDLALQLLAKFFAFCPGKTAAPPLSPAPAINDSPRSGSNPLPSQKTLSDPDRVLARIDSFVQAYGSRALLYETWAGNPSLFELILLLFDRSEFLAETAIRTPDLVDELELSGRLRRRKSTGEILEDLRHGRLDADQRLWIRRYHQAELMRIGLRDILELADFEQNLVELSALAEACLQYALEAVLRKNKIKSPPFVIIALGKLGGSEINYGSDLDLMFVTDSKTKDLSSFQKIALETMDLLSSPTELGVAFETDVRLRPDGEKGLLVNSLPAYEDYYRHRAQLWEIQSLSRIRPVAGDMKTGEAFVKLAAALTDFSNVSQPLEAYTPQWKQEIARMRRRIEKERTPPGKDHLAIKTGFGGLMDAEFSAQILCLARGWREPNTLRALERARDTASLPADAAEQLIQNYRRLRHIEGILRRWSYAGETLLPDDPAPFYRVAVRCGFPGPEPFMAALRQYRSAIRDAYLQVLNS
jgi:[glutamine synthetase] adenylyltransferase / [glutamine synthetase]-adenylyl-L-tyrosine phosphorylase